ncbi:MAG: hypothetical protein Fues2KO_00480 [Fuerstiella sp.]
MRTLRREWLRSALVAIATVSVSTVGLSQAQERISDRNDDFSDVNRIIREGSGSVPGFNFDGTGRNGQRINTTNVDRRVLLNLLTESVDESEKLYRSLQQDAVRSPSVRSLLPELLTMRAQASRIAQDVQANMSLDRLLPQLQQLDSDWHLVSHRMSQTRGLSNASRDSVARLDRLDRSLEKLFQMDPQLDRRAVMTELAQLSSALRNLVQELDFDTTAGSRLTNLILQTRKMSQQVTRIQDQVLDLSPYTRIVSEYNRFEQTWSEVTPELRQLNNRYIERIMRNVQLSDARMHELLWLEQKTSRENLRQIAGALERDVNEFFNRVPLKLLLHFKNVSDLLETSDNFYGTVQHFKDCVDRNENDQTLLDCYRYVEEYGNVFVKTFQPLRSSQGVIVLREIEDGMLALRNELRLAGTVTYIDTATLLPTAAALENLADHLDLDVQAWLHRDRQSFRNDALLASTQFLKRTQKIHRMLATRPSGDQLRREVSDLIEEWRRIYQYLGRCNTGHREHLRNLSQDISQAIYNLRAPLQQ